MNKFSAFSIAVLCLSAVSAQTNSPRPLAEVAPETNRALLKTKLPELRNLLSASLGGSASFQEADLKDKFLVSHSGLVLKYIGGAPLMGTVDRVPPFYQGLGYSEGETATLTWFPRRAASKTDSRQVQSIVVENIDPFRRGGECTQVKTRENITVHKLVSTNVNIISNVWAVLPEHPQGYCTVFTVSSTTCDIKRCQKLEQPDRLTLVTSDRRLAHALSMLGEEEQTRMDGVTQRKEWAMKPADRRANNASACGSMSCEEEANRKLDEFMREDALRQIWKR